MIAEAVQRLESVRVEGRVSVMLFIVASFTILHKSKIGEFRRRNTGFCRFFPFSLPAERLIPRVFHRGYVSTLRISGFLYSKEL